MRKNLLIFLLFFLVPIFIVDYYIFNVASPVTPTEYKKRNTKAPRPPVKSPPPKVKEVESAAPDTPVEVEEEKEDPIGCNLKKSVIRFKDYKSQENSIAFNICDSILQESALNRSKVNPADPHQGLVDFDAPLINGVVETYRKEIKKNNLGYKAGAEYVVSSIQNIPYTLVHVHSHKDAELAETYIKEGLTASVAKNLAKQMRETHKKKKAFSPLDQIGGCLEDIGPSGVVSPLEMFFNQMGDCDSRATALFLVLKKLGYDVLEIGSDVEGHALLAINLPNADGNIYYKYRGKKYYVWETTFFHPAQSRVGVHNDGQRYMKNWHLWRVALK